MVATRLSSVDASFLEVESQTATMHVGWVSLFDPPVEGSQPTFEELRDFIGGRLARAPRYRQRLAWVPLGLHDPLWVDDENFDIRNHVRHSHATDLSRAVDRAMSQPLDRERPLWEFWIADQLPGGRLAVIGKAHHCLVDGIAAVELASLVLDPTPEPPSVPDDGWTPAPAPGGLRLLADGVRDRVGEELDLFKLPAGVLRSPRRLLAIGADAGRAVRALSHSFSPARTKTPFNAPISRRRHLARLQRPLADLKQIKQRHHGTTVNDVVLAATAGAVRGYLLEHGEEPMRLKTMVPVNVRGDGSAGDLGNRISFVFVPLPADEENPLLRLHDVHAAMSARKRAGEPAGGDLTLNAIGYAPHVMQHAISHAVASPRAFNLVVSNIPGLRQPFYMAGCEMQEAYPIVPLADRHALAVGITNVKEEVFFGLYADRETLPDADRLAEHLDRAIDELLEHSPD